MESLVKIVGAGVDTLVMNIYPTDSAGAVVKRRVASELQDELTQLKEPGKFTLSKTQNGVLVRYNISI